MNIKQYNTVNEFWAEVGKFLLTDPVKHNIVIGQLASTLDRNKILTNTELFALFENEKLILTVFKNRPNIILYGENYNRQHLQRLSDYFKSKTIELKGGIGEKNLIEEFSKIYSPKYSIDKTLIGHKLEKLETIKLSEGEIKKCGNSDLEFVKGWVEEFGIECKIPHRRTGNDLEAMIQHRINQGSMYKWVIDERSVSICGEVVSNEYFQK